MNTNTESVSTDNTNTDTTTVVEVLAKPKRQDFYRDVVLNASGDVVDESVWKGVVGDEKLTGRALAGKLRRNSMQIVHLFDKPGFEKAKSEFRSASKTAKNAARESLIVGAFQKAGVQNEPHIERALKDLLPLFSETSPAKTGIVLKNVVRTISNGLEKAA